MGRPLLRVQRPLFALLPQLAARWIAAVCQSDACRLRPARCHGARAGIPGDCHSQPGPVTAARATGSLVRQLRCDAGRWLPCRGAREWSTYRCAERDWLSPGGPTLSQRPSPVLDRSFAAPAESENSARKSQDEQRLTRLARPSAPLPLLLLLQRGRCAASRCLV
jgi:hypothetical protein